MERMDKNSKELMDDPFLLASWIAKSMAGELSDEELQLLDEWRMASGRNRRLYDRIVSREGWESKQKHFTAFDKVSGWQGYSKKLKKTEKKAIRWRVFLRYAAVLLIPLGAAVYGVLHSGEETVSLADLNAITPGGTRAELVLPSGEVVDLVEKSGVISRGENTVINNEGKTLSYKSTGNQAPMDSLRYNEVIVPKGGEYQLVLSDGTLVYLNSMTKVRFPESSSFGVKPVSKEGSQRLVRSAIEYALERKLPSVTLVHKGNIMKFTEGGFKNWGYDVAESEFGDRTFTMRAYEAIKKESGSGAADEALSSAVAAGRLVVKDVIADAFLQNTLLVPQEYSVIATLNLNGDYISDQLAAMVGGIGIAPGANINFRTGHAIFEATHGTAPNIAGRNVVNPSSILLSAVMMLEYMGWTEAAAMITAAMERAFESGRATSDLTRFMERGTPLGTVEFGREVTGNL